MPAQLVPLLEGRTITLDKGILVIGRHAECDVQILSPKISRLHCCIAQVGSYLIVRDLQSTNGIRVNGVRVLEGRLGAGDELTIGNHSYQVCGDIAPLKHAPAPAAGGKAAAKAMLRVPSVKDLESCDEPVPLPEPGGPRARKAAIVPQEKAAPPVRMDDSNGRTESSSVPVEEPPLVLPSEDPQPAPLPLPHPEYAPPPESAADSSSHPSH
jgi:predicted component of type VI protein secretion system